MTITVRLDAKTEGILERLARKRRQTKSEVIRETIMNLESNCKQHLPEETFYSKASHLIGCVDSGDSRLSENTGERFRKIVQEKARGRWTG